MKYKYHTGIECPKCLDQIFSWHRHDFKYCKCKEVFVDGGFDYLRYSHCKDGTRPKLIKRRFKVNKDGKFVWPIERFTPQSEAIQSKEA